LSPTAEAEGSQPSNDKINGDEE